MRWVFAAPLILGLCGCIGFHPLEPDWRRSKNGGDDVDAAMSADAELVARARRQASAWRSIGESYKGRPLRICQIGRGPRRVLWIGGIHGNEQEGVVATDELPEAFIQVPGALNEVTLTILEDVNPDGRASNSRHNAQGIDLNRNYPATNFLPGRNYGKRPLDQPEAKALHDLIQAERPHLVIVAHSWGNDHFINFDGPAVELAELFSRCSGYRVKPSDRISPTPGSLGSWVGRTLGVPILTLEYERGRAARQCWLETREAILAVILAREPVGGLPAGDVTSRSPASSRSPVSSRSPASSRSLAR
ncbi:MAG: M14 family zinc carboxypeptidase [Planctomycetota bacterium]